MSARRHSFKYDRRHSIKPISLLRVEAREVVEDIIRKNFTNGHKRVGEGMSRRNMPRIVQDGVVAESLREELSLTDR